MKKINLTSAKIIFIAAMILVFIIGVLVSNDLSERKGQPRPGALADTIEEYLKGYCVAGTVKTYESIDWGKVERRPGFLVVEHSYRCGSKLKKTSIFVFDSTGRIYKVEDLK